MSPLQRHRLVWLHASAWRRLLAPAHTARWDAQALDCLRHWADAKLPLVVAHQTPGWTGERPDESVVLGLAAPLHWDRRRLFVEVPASDVQRVGAFAAASAITAALPQPAQASWRVVCRSLERLGAEARVYGSYGWQQVTGMAYVRDSSDIDLLVTVATSRRADAVSALLDRTAFEVPRLDGEIVFDDGAAVAWREWAAWRAGSAAQVLVKRVSGAALETPDSWRVAT